jgi:replicative DNA helicase
MPELFQVGDLLDDAVSRIRARADGTERPVDTPWPALNDALRGGLWPGLVVLTGKSGDGKTQMALQLTLHAAKQGIPGLYIGLELDRLGFASRLMAMEYREEHNYPVQWSDLYVGRDPEGNDPATPTLIDVMKYGRNAVKNLPIHFEEGPPQGWPVSWLNERARQVREGIPEEKPILIVLDFLQIVGRDDGDKSDLRELIRKAAYTGRAVAREYNAVVVLVSSTARENYGRLSGKDRSGKAIDGWPQSVPPGELLGTGKESGEIEYAADVGLVLCRKTYKAGEGSPPVHLAVAKVRAGITSWLTLDFDGCMFENDREPENNDKSDMGGKFDV